MNILIYCQHVLGIGHLFRTLEIARVMDKHRVLLVTGGPPVTMQLPGHVRAVQLPGLMMDAAFSGLLPVDDTLSLDSVKEHRRSLLFKLLENFRPDVLITELYPFGRNGFSFELLPLLKAIRNGELPSCRVVSSVRDILVEKKNQQKYEQRVIDRLSRYYDTVLVHGDPDIIRLDATFSRIKDITTPIIYTGYVCQQATEDEGRRHRLQLRVQPGEKLIVASAGSGSVGLRLLLATVHAAHHLSFPFKMYIFTGPYMEHADVTELQQEAPANIIVERFADRFPVWLTAADLSISMGGYNTTMNVLAAGIPSLIYPFSQNREQRLRCQRLARVANLELLEDMDLSPRTMAGKISRMFDRRTKQVHLRLDGAEFTNNWLTQWINVK